LGRKVGA